MYLTIHSPTSLIIGSQINHPILSFGLAFLFHLILDIIPHDSLELNGWIEKHKLKRMFFITSLDFMLMTIFLFILYYQNKLNMSLPLLTTLLGGIMPDILWGLDDLTQNKFKILGLYHNFHHKIHQLFYNKIFIPLKYSIPIQITVFISTLWVYWTLQS